MIKPLQIGILAFLFTLGLCFVADAEYLIYLKGGHFIVADDCTLATHEVRKDSEVSEQSIRSDELSIDVTEDCTKGKPDGRILWSTMNGHSGEVNADDVYAILGTRSLSAIKPSSATMPLEDYLITNRGESFVNAKAVEEQGVDVHALKRDDLAKVNRRSVIEIAPERLAKSRSGEGLCPGEPPEFTVSEVEIVDGHLVGVVTNLSKTPWRPWIDVEVSVKGRRRGKFQIEDPSGRAPLPNILIFDESTSIDQLVPARLLKELERLKDTDAGVRLCYRKIKTTAREAGGLENVSAQPSAK